MKHYNHLTFEERERIALLRVEGLCASQIAAQLGRHKTTIRRELRRNSNADDSYRPLSAERRYMARRQRERRLDLEPELARFIRERLQDGWTPEQVSGWLAAGHEALPTVSFETIYDWLFAKPQKTEGLHKLLPTKRSKRGHKKRRQIRSTIPGRRSVHDRPEDANTRRHVGHWEGDLMICKRRRPVLVLKERKSRYVIATRLSGKTAAETANTIMEVFRKLDPSLRKSITFDNGGEFAKHAMLREALNMTTWFCDAYASWQKGAVENANGRLRRDLPRNRDIDQMSDEEVQDILLTHNLTPRKCLGFKTPAQALLKEMGTDIKIVFKSNDALRA